MVDQAPEPQFVIAPDNARIATYDLGDPEAPAVLAIHGFASSADVNWFATGWTRDLVRAGYRVVALDLRGHGRSDKPHSPAAYSMNRLVADVEVVLDTYLLDETAIVGYSLGARVGWHAAIESPHRIVKAVLGGIPDGRPLRRVDVAQARAHVLDGRPVTDRITQAYLDMAARSPNNDLSALIALVEGVQHGLQPDPARPPEQPVLFATGSDDGIVDASRRLAAATPLGTFYSIEGRNHFNAPTARPFRERAIDFLDSTAIPTPRAPIQPEQQLVEQYAAGIAALLLAGSTPDIVEKELEQRWPAWIACLARAEDLLATRRPPQLPRPSLQETP